MNWENLKNIIQKVQNTEKEELLPIDIKIFNEKIRTAVLDSICKSLEDSNVLSNYNGIPGIQKWLTLLEKEGLIKKEGECWEIIVKEKNNKSIWEELQSCDFSSIIPIEGIMYIKAHADQFVSLLQGKFSGMNLLFPEGRTDIAEKIYGGTAINRFLNRSIAGIVSALSEERPLHILEVGGGVGATTIEVLKRLEKKKFDYMFSDVSMFFLNNIKRKFPSINTAILNLDNIKNISIEEKYDVIIAAGVLNSVKNIPNAVRNLVGMLDKEGILLITEPVQEHIEIDMTQGFIQQEFSDFRKNTGRWYLEKNEWIRLFNNLDCKIECIPRDNDEYAKLGFELIVVQPYVQQQCEYWV